MHIPPFDNQNKAIIDIHNANVPLTYFNIVKLEKGQVFSYQIPGYETCIVPATGSVDVDVDTASFGRVGNRGSDVWDGEPEGVYVPTDMPAQIVCTSKSCEVFVAGARYQDRLATFAVRKNEIDVVQYGSDDTKTHRKIKHILGQKQAGKVGRLLVSELYTVGAGGWSGFPPINMTQIVCPMRPGMMRCIISDLSLVMALACNCWSLMTTNWVKRFILLTDPALRSSQAITLV